MSETTSAQSEHALISWHGVRYDGPSPDEDLDYRGPDVVAVPGDTVRVSTRDGDLEGEPVRELCSGERWFLLLVDDGVVYEVSHSAISCYDPMPFGHVDDHA